MSAPQSWRRFSLLVPPSDVEPASALLATATGASVAVEEPGEDDAGRTTHIRVSAFVHSSQSKSAARNVRALFAHARREGVLRDARPQRAVTVRDEDWGESWKRFYKSFPIAPRLWIAPSWESEFRAPRGARTLWMDPGMAFGTGQHPTTVLALRMMLPLVIRGRKLIDAGCGSGILGLAAGLAGARVYACDVDPVATAAARANFRANDVRPVSLRQRRRSSGLRARTSAARRREHHGGRACADRAFIDSVRREERHAHHERRDAARANSSARGVQGRGNAPAGPTARGRMVRLRAPETVSHGFSAIFHIRIRDRRRRLATRRGRRASRVERPALQDRRSADAGRSGCRLGCGNRVDRQRRRQRARDSGLGRTDR